MSFPAFARPFFRKALPIAKQIVIQRSLHAIEFRRISSAADLKTVSPVVRMFSVAHNRVAPSRYERFEAPLICLAMLKLRPQRDRLAGSLALSGTDSRRPVDSRFHPGSVYSARETPWIGTPR